MRKICIATGTRADWGLLCGIAKALKERKDVKLQIIATNMHLSPKFGNTYKEIVADGFKINCHIPLLDNTDTAGDTVRSMGIAMNGFASAFEELEPYVLVILGDRTEMLAASSAALIFRIPIVHIAGGAISEGAYDDSIRHCITKMSHIHLTETEQYRQRVIQLGENPKYVINTGAIGVHNILNANYLSKAEIEKEVGLTIGKNTLMVTFHPATLDTVEPKVQCENLLKALDEHPECNIVFTYPNNDANGRVIISLIEQYVGSNHGRCVVFPSLGQLRYLSVLKYAGAVVGNSSSGIVEVPSMGIPTLDIGIRQRGRLAADSVIHCGVTKEEISKGLNTVLSDEIRQLASLKNNPYQQPDTLNKIVKAICETPLDNIIIKHFYDINK
ncbi:MAG: UDP-N-acetylglucosamine 2-epimerase [Muribaculaceae bacterium]|nr:UDP-N-acetylglucosamine 2-epimerase [Muribaculaceae bacterium]